MLKPKHLKPRCIKTETVEELYDHKRPKNNVQRQTLPEGIETRFLIISRFINNLFYKGLL